jgi:hypothetical protein
MKKITLSAILIVGVAFSAQAQINLGNAGKNIVSSATNSVGAGKLLTQLASGINPGSFTEKWASAKSGWLSKASKVTSAGTGGQLLSQLIGYIKPAAFNNNFVGKVSGLMNTAKTVTTMQGLGNTASTLVGGIKDQSFSSSFLNNKSTYLSALSMLK